MSFVPRCTVGSPPSEGDSGKEMFVRYSCKKESKRKSSWKIVSLRVPGTADDEKSSSVPGIIRVCQEPHRQKKLRNQLNRPGFVMVPEMLDLGAPEERQSSETSASNAAVPSIKRCSLDEIEALKCSQETVAGRKQRNTTEKGGGRTQRGAKLSKTPVRHFLATPGTGVRVGITGQIPLRYTIQL